jgi:tripartite-type tricarboxylate transporter receptor subunit TctC
MARLHPTRRAALALLATPALGIRAARAAEDWPDRPVRLVVPFGAGGASDTLARTCAQALSEEFPGKSMVVENRGGAGGTLAGQAVASARPDGTTLMLADLSANAIAHELIRGVPYDPPTAFTPIIHLTNLPVVIIVNPALPVHNAAEFFALARQRAATPMTYAHPGIGYPSQLAHELLLQMTGTKMTPVAYRSGAEVLRATISGECDCAIPTVSTSAPFIREGRVRPIAVLTAQRVPQLPEVPPVADTIPGFESSVWNGIVGPAGMEAALVARINAVFARIMRRPEVAQRVQQAQAAQVVAGSPAEFAALIRSEIARWTPLIRANNLRAE